MNNSNRFEIHYDGQYGICGMDEGVKGLTSPNTVIWMLIQYFDGGGFVFPRVILFCTSLPGDNNSDDAADDDDDGSCLPSPPLLATSLLPRTPRVDSPGKQMLRMLVCLLLW